MQPCAGKERETTPVLVADGERDAAAGRLVGDRWQWLASMEGVAAKEMMGTTP